MLIVWTERRLVGVPVFYLVLRDISFEGESLAVEELARHLEEKSVGGVVGGGEGAGGEAGLAVVFGAVQGAEERIAFELGDEVAVGAAIHVGELVGTYDRGGVGEVDGLADEGSADVETDGEGVVGRDEVDIMGSDIAVGSRPDSQMGGEFNYFAVEGDLVVLEFVEGVFFAAGKEESHCDA